MSNSKKTTAMSLADKKREEVANKTYMVERLLKRRKRKGRIEYLVKWKHWDRSHNSWEPEGNILDQTLIDLYEEKHEEKRKSQQHRMTTSPLKEKPIEEETPPIDYWQPPKCEQKHKYAITDITADNVTITFRELI